MMHIRLSGLCAQAVCLMAGCLIHDYATPDQPKAMPAIHGVAEVSAVIAGDWLNEMILTGLTPTQMVQYLCDVGRSARREVSFQTREGFTAVSAFELSVRSYVLSGFPVILLVDSRRFWRSPSVMKATPSGNSGQGTSSEASPQRLNHAVLVVGVSRDKPTSLLINDPAIAPFLELPLEELLRSTSGPPTAVSHPHSIVASMIPVVPHQVQFGLQTNVPREAKTDNDSYPGLFDVADSLQNVDRNYLDRWFRDWEPGEFWLVRRGDVDRLRFEQSLAKALRDVMSYATATDHWFWIQLRPESGAAVREVWVWDAERTAHTGPPSWAVLKSEVGLKQRFLRGMLRYARGRWTRTELTCVPIPPDTTEREIDVDMTAPRISPPLKPALISSVDIRGLHRCAKWWPHDVPCEVYAFAHSDELFKAAVRQAGLAGAGSLNPSNIVVAQMAELSANASAVKYLAGEIVDALKRKHAPVIGLASFVPEIIPVPEPAHTSRSLIELLGSTPPSSNGVGQRAVRFLIELARELSRAQGNALINIEVVGGSTVAGVWTGRSGATDGMLEEDDERGYFLNRFRKRQAIELLVQAAKGILSTSSLGNEEGRFVLSFELEPGGNFVLGDNTSLEQMFTMVTEDDPFSQFLGINLDISHWTLVGIEPRMLIDPRRRDKKRARAILGRISHAHISDVALAHFGDAPLGELSGYYRASLDGSRNGPWGTLDVFTQCYSRYKPWFDLIAHARALKSKDDRLPPYSGYISIELEAARSPRQAFLSLERLHSLIWAWEADGAPMASRSPARLSRSAGSSQ
jgi:hypothetical protein